ncbi:hypothetical protein D9M68_427340 [compost metagenome]
MRGVVGARVGAERQAALPLHAAVAARGKADVLRGRAARHAAQADGTDVARHVGIEPRDGRGHALALREKARPVARPRSARPAEHGLDLAALPGAAGGVGTGVVHVPALHEAVHRGVDVHALRRGALHADDVGAPGHRAVGAVVPVFVAVGRVQFFLVDVVGVERAHRRTPGDGAVGAEQHGQQADGREAREVVARAMQADAVHERRVVEALLRAVVQDGHAFLGARGAEHPGVAGGRHALGGGQAHAGDLRGAEVGGGLRGDRRERGVAGLGARQPVRVAARHDGRRGRVFEPAQLLVELQAGDVAARGLELVEQRKVRDLGGAREEAVEDQADPDHGHVVRGPGRGLEAVVDELARHQLRAVGQHVADARVDARGVAFEQGAVVGAQRFDLAADRHRIDVGTRRLVGRHELGPQHLGHAAVARAPRHLQLVEPVFGDGIAEAVEQAARVAGVDVRHAVAVALDGDLAAAARGGRGAAGQQRGGEQHGAGRAPATQGTKQRVHGVGGVHRIDARAFRAPASTGPSRASRRRANGRPSRSARSA